MSVVTGQEATNLGRNDGGNTKAQGNNTGGVTKPGKSALNSVGVGPPWPTPNLLSEAQAAWKSNSTRREKGR